APSQAVSPCAWSSGVDSGPRIPLRFEASCGRGPVDASIETVEEILIGIGLRHMSKRRVERSSAIVLLIPAQRMKRRCLGLLTAHRRRLVGRLIDRKQITEVLGA